MSATQTSNGKTHQKPSHVLHLTGSSPDDRNQLRTLIKTGSEKNDAKPKATTKKGSMISPAVQKEVEKKAGEKLKKKDRIEAKPATAGGSSESSKKKRHAELDAKLQADLKAHEDSKNPNAEEKTTVAGTGTSTGTQMTTDPQTQEGQNQQGSTVVMIENANNGMPTRVSVANIPAQQPSMERLSQEDREVLDLLRLRQGIRERKAMKRAQEEFVPVQFCLGGDTFGGWPISSGSKVILRAPDGTKYKRIVYVDQTIVGLNSGTGVPTIRRRAYFYQRLPFGDFKIRVYLDTLGALSAKLHKEMSGAQKKRLKKKSKGKK